MNATLAILALLVFNMGGVFDLTGVGPGVATGRVLYTNGTKVGVVASVNGSVFALRDYTPLDAGWGTILMASRDGKLLVAYKNGSMYQLGDVVKSMPPYRVTSKGALVTAGLVALLVNKSGAARLRVDGLLVVDYRDGVVLGSRGGNDAVILRGSSALLYEGLAPLALCNETHAVVVYKGDIGILGYRNGLVTLIHVDNVKPVWGETLDYSIASCSDGTLAFTGRANSTITIVVLDTASGSCWLVKPLGEVRGAGVAVDGKRVTAAFSVKGGAKLAIYKCRFKVESLFVEPKRLNATILLESVESSAVSIERLPAVNKTTMLAPNLLLAVLEVRSSGESGAGKVKLGNAPGVPVLLLLVIFFTLLASILLARRSVRRISSAESARHHPG